MSGAQVMGEGQPMTSDRWALLRIPPDPISTEPLFYFICHAQCKSKNCQRWIKGSASRKYGTSRNIQIIDSMNTTILVDDTLFRVSMHTGCPHVMLISTQVAWPFIISFQKSRLKSAESRAIQLCCHEFIGHYNAAPIFCRKVPVNNNSSQSERIAIIAKPNPAEWIGHLLGRTLERYPFEWYGRFVAAI